MTQKTFNELECESILKYSFKDKTLLKSAFTHASVGKEYKESENNERLEFLGDSILGFIVAEYLYKNFSSAEGVLTKLKQSLVSKEPLSFAIEKLGLFEFLIVGVTVDLENQTTKKTLSENLFEAIVGAIYLDGGIEYAKKFVYDNLIFSDVLSKKFVIKTDFKSKLQEFCAKRKLGKVDYVLIEKLGPDHSPSFTVAVIINGTKFSQSTAGSKKQAEQDCAKSALDILQREG